MRAVITLSIFLLFFAIGCADKQDDQWALKKIDEGLYGLEIDSTGTKCLIVESDQSLCLIEVSLSKKGGGAQVLKEDRQGGEAILRFLRKQFPKKPLNAVLHSHWHPHSITSVAPFLEQGIPLITTRSNFERIREFVDSTLVETSVDLIRYVEGDSIVVGEGPQQIIAYRLLKEDYPSIPSPEYLFFHLPGFRVLHCSCMYSKWSGEPVNGRQVLSSREQDLHKFIMAKGLDLDGLIRLNLEKDSETGQVLPFAGLADVIENGVTSKELTSPWRDLSADELHASRDRIVTEIIENGIPARLFNGLVYQAFAQQELARAKEFALLQVLAGPSSANAWDTLGEAHYFLGEIAVARTYEDHSRRIDPEFDGGGEAVWEKALADYQKRWSEQQK